MTFMYFTKTQPTCCVRLKYNHMLFLVQLKYKGVGFFFSPIDLHTFPGGNTLLKQQVRKRIWVKLLGSGGKGHLIYLILLYIFLH